MKKQLWLNLFLFVLMVVLIFLLVNAVKPIKDKIDMSQRLFQTTFQQAKRIHIERQGRAVIVLIKQHEQWLLIKPALAPLNHQRIQHLLTILNEPIQHQLVRQAGDLKNFKLDVERIKLTINDEEITFGMVNPVTNNRYVLKNTTIYTIKEIVYGTLGSSVTHLLQHRLLPVQMKVINIEAPTSFYQTTRAHNDWEKLEAINIADYSVNETILGNVSLTIQHAQHENEQTKDKPALTTLVFDILAITPTLILGRADLKVKYTLDNRATKRLFAIE